MPLHIFEPRYRELIAECLEQQQEFGLIYADDDGVREVGTRARVIDVLEEFEDGRLNIVVEGGERFRVEQLTRGRSFLTAIVGAGADATRPGRSGHGGAGGPLVPRARSARRRRAGRARRDGVAALVRARRAGRASGRRRSSSCSSSTTSKQRLELVIGLLDSVREALLAARELSEHAKTNGARRHDSA